MISIFTLIYFLVDENKKDDLEQKSPTGKDQSQDQERRGSKRKHTSSQDNTGCVQDMVAVEPSSPTNSLALLYQSAVNDDTNTLNHIYNDDLKYNGEKQRVDTKNSRRKMERPRKRKRESDTEIENQIDPIIEVDNPVSIETMLNGNSGEPTVQENGASLSVTGSSHSSLPASPQDIVNKLKSPAPEDLSLKASHINSVSSPAQSNNATPNLSDTSTEKWPNTSTSTNSDVYPEVSTSTSSVRDLEEAMNKHLPALSSDTVEHLRTGFHGDYASAQGLLGFHKHKSTIQWIGSQHSQTPEMTATHLLRTLYANRESVIRTNVYNPRPQYYADMQPSLLTPPGPGTESSPFTTPQVNQAKTPPSTYGIMPAGYSSNPISVTMSAGNLSEPYSMTPPSSVSPQDKYCAPYSDQCHAEAQIRSYTDGTNLSIPVKPQAYPLPAHANAHMSAYDRSAQYSGGNYYPSSGSFAAYSHASNPTPAHYRDATKNCTW